MSAPPRQHGSDYADDQLPPVRSRKPAPYTPKFRKFFEELGAPAFYDELILNRLALYMIDSEASADGDSRVPAGYTYFGQLVDHDITHDLHGGSHPLNDLPESDYQYSGTPQLDLMSVYGDKFERLQADGTFRLGNVEHRFYDLPRKNNGVADIADARNEDNLAVAQLQLLFMALHNALVIQHAVTDRDEAVARIYPAVTRCFCHLVRDDYLPRITCYPALHRVTSGGERLFYPVGSNFMPLEFSGAAFRFGHSQVRPRYRWSVRSDGYPFVISALQLIDATGLGTLPLPEHGLTPAWVMNWRYFFPGDYRDGEANWARKINPWLSFDLSRLPHSGAGILAHRNLLRGWKQYDLPSAQDLMARAGLEPTLGEQQVLDYAAEFMVSDRLAWFEQQDLHRHTPLWYFILLEAHAEGGSQLGMLGSTIVSEVLWELADQTDELLDRGYPEAVELFKAEMQAGKLKMRDVLDYVVTRCPKSFSV